MIFQHSWQAILEGRKSQTRRLVVPELDTLQNGAVIRCGEPPRVRWEVGKDYAVQPGRGKAAVMWRQNDDGSTAYIPDVIEYRPSFDAYNSETDFHNLTRVDRRPFWADHGYVVARIRILSIRREDVREISDADVKAEGFKTASDFFITWVKMHDKSVITPIIHHTGAIVWQGVHDYLSTRPAGRYDAWAIEFEVVT